VYPERDLTSAGTIAIEGVCVAVRSGHYVVDIEWGSLRRRIIAKPNARILAMGGWPATGQRVRVLGCLWSDTWLCTWLVRSPDREHGGDED